MQAQRSRRSDWDDWEDGPRVRNPPKSRSAKKRQIRQDIYAQMEELV